MSNNEKPEVPSSAWVELGKVFQAGQYKPSETAILTPDTAYLFRMKPCGESSMKRTPVDLSGTYLTTEPMDISSITIGITTVSDGMLVDVSMASENTYSVFIEGIGTICSSIPQDKVEDIIYECNLERVDDNILYDLYTKKQQSCDNLDRVNKELYQCCEELASNFKEVQKECSTLKNDLQLSNCRVQLLSDIVDGLKDKYEPDNKIFTVQDDDFYERISNGGYFKVISTVLEDYIFIFQVDKETRTVGSVDCITGSFEEGTLHKEDTLINLSKDYEYTEVTKVEYLQAVIDSLTKQNSTLQENNQILTNKLEQINNLSKPE